MGSMSSVPTSPLMQQGMQNSLTGAIPDSVPVTGPEVAKTVGEHWYVAGRPWAAVGGRIKTGQLRSY